MTRSEKNFVTLAKLLLTTLAVCLNCTASAAPPATVHETYDEVTLKRFETLQADNPILSQDDPYAYYADKPAELSIPETMVCAIRFTDAAKTHYHLQTYPDANSARADGAHVTHKGLCGTCSTLKDLAVYLRKPDLTAPVRRCGIMSGIKSLAMSYLKDIGFTDACAETWYYNAKNTARQCFTTCMRSWIAGEASNKPDGSLNNCLECDEIKSGPVFKRAAGRTRRNSGIVSSIGRGSGEFHPLAHDY